MEPWGDRSQRGYGIEIIRRFFEEVAFVEFGGGMLLVAGFLTRCAALAVLIDMLVAIFTVHFKHGFTGAGNYQLPLSLAVAPFHAATVAWLTVTNSGSR